MRMKELVFLNSGIELYLWMFDKKMKEYEDEKFFFVEGLKDYVLDFISDVMCLYELIMFSGIMDGVCVEGVFCWIVDLYFDMFLGYANSIRMIDGGTYFDGLKYFFTKMFNVVSCKVKFLKDFDFNFGGDYICEGLFGVIVVWVFEFEFEG